MNALDLTFGVEIEFKSGATRARIAEALNAAGIDAGYTHATTAAWKVVVDGSVHNGHEVVSPILKGADGLAQVEAVCRVLQGLGATVDRQCGLHVHVGARDLGLRTVKGVAARWMKYERAIDGVLPPSRRANNARYCQSNLVAPVADLIAKINRAESVREVAEVTNPGQNRYRKLNLMSFWRHGTIEFRAHSGTVEGEKITSWVKLVTGMVALAHNGVDLRAPTGDQDPAKLLPRLTGRALKGDRKAQAFYRKRAAKFAEAA